MLRKKRLRTDRWRLLASLLPLLSFLPASAVAGAAGTDPTSDEILAHVAEGIAKGQTFSYSGTREYRLRNYRFEKEAVVLIQANYRPDSGKDFTFLQRTGSPKLLEIIDKLLVSETEVSRPEKFVQLEISPLNYVARLVGIDATRGRRCYVLELIPKRKSKYLIKGTAWIDSKTYGVMRLDGVTSASVSLWVGTAHITQDFAQVSGIWLPTHTGGVSSGLLLGASELEIRYSDYLVMDVDHSGAVRAADGLQQP
jgi:outer membrane lipoprotein-sorting protein